MNLNTFHLLKKQRSIQHQLYKRGILIKNKTFIGVNSLPGRHQLGELPVMAWVVLMNFLKNVDRSTEVAACLEITQVQG